MRVLIAVDKFKGSLSALEVARAVQAGLEKAGGDWCFDLCPIADGGEGTVAAVVPSLGGQWVSCEVEDALGRAVEARYGLVGDAAGAGVKAVMEMSAASGLALVADLPAEPMRASTFGTGQLMADAMRRGAESILIGIGGSGTNDGGMGMAQALGFRFLDDHDREAGRMPVHFEQVSGLGRPVPGDVLAEWGGRIEVACDVENPLLGEAGATRVYGAQKGVRAEDMDFFERRLRRLADLVKRDLGVDPRAVPGAGAAGGLGFGLMAFCGASLVSGFELVASLVGLRDRIEKADWVITGEGRLDGQTLHGKGPVGVARMARAAGKRVAAVAGSVESCAALEAEFDLLLAVKPEAMPLVEAMACGGRLIEETVERHAARFTR